MEIKVKGTWVSDKDTSCMKSKSFRQRQLLFVLFTQGVLQNVPDFVITNPQQILGIKWKFFQACTFSQFDRLFFDGTG